MVTTLKEITDAGVSIWLDDLSRGRIASGGLADYISRLNVRGVTTNPTIFENAIASGSADYSEQIENCAKAGLNADETVRLITTDDVRDACDLFMKTFEESGGVDGRVSIEVDPRLARDTQGTIDSARDLWRLVDRPNVLIKIPATAEGLPAITAIIGEGISVNVTLIFSVERYKEVIDAYIAGLELANTNEIDLSSIQSVASFFISRLDSSVDSALKEIGTDRALSLLGKAAISNARVAWQVHLDTLASRKWRQLSRAQVQRPLWASTGVKDPAYADTRYVMELIGPGCVNTMPEKTLLAVQDHGQFHGDTLSGMANASSSVLEELADIGIDLNQILAELEVDGVDKFEAAWQQLLSAVDQALAQGSASIK
jgi:transaldolase